MTLLLLSALAVLAAAAIAVSAAWVLMRVDVEVVIPSQDEQVMVVEVPKRIQETATPSRR
jgi:hypothetical protein